MPRRFVRIVLKLVALWMVCFIAVEVYFTAVVKLRSNGGPSMSTMARHLKTDGGAIGTLIKEPQLLARRENGLNAEVSDLSRRERSVHSLKFGGESKHSHDSSSSLKVKDPTSRRQTELNDIFISVKTSRWYLKRLDLILETWYIMARDQVRLILSQTWVVPLLQYIAPKCRINAMVFSFYPRAIRIWNMIPSKITNIKNPKSFQEAIMELPFTTPPHLNCL